MSNCDQIFEEELELVCEIMVRTDGYTEEEVGDFFRRGCGCKSYSCTLTLSPEDVSQYRLAVSELERSELDLIILAQLHAGMNAGNLLTNTRGTARPDVRQRVMFQYLFKGMPICREMFLFLHRISRTRLYNLVEHLSTNGVIPRTHGNTGKKPKHACSFQEIQRVVDFIKCYADVHAVPLPGRLPKHQDYRVMKLPSDVSKASIYRDYCVASAALNENGENVRIISYRQFCRLWQQLLPFVTTMKPSSDLCFIGQENVAAIMRSTNLPEKSDKLKAAEEHLAVAKAEREVYISKKQQSREIWKGLPQHKQKHGNPTSSLPISMLYSFDHAQVLHFPSNPLQPGPAYFKTARKCEVFGVCCEGSRTQVNYLIDEGESIGKGANAIISYVHHYLETYSVGERDLQLQADNCVGQNKNYSMIQYLTWRCLTGRNDSCLINFMIVGHTRFSPDQYFGMIKRKYRKTRVSSIAQIANIVSQSTESVVNKVHLAFDPNNQERVQCYDWKSFLSSFLKPIPSITRYHHFNITKTKPGIVELKEFDHSPVENVSIVKIGEVVPITMPELILPPGISFERQTYLFEQVRMFCEPEYADITCPKPGSALQPHTEDSELNYPRSKRARLCSHCRGSDHTKTVRGKITCPELLEKTYFCSNLFFTTYILCCF